MERLAKYVTAAERQNDWLARTVVPGIKKENEIWTQAEWEELEEAKKKALGTVTEIFVTKDGSKEIIQIQSHKEITYQTAWEIAIETAKLIPFDSEPNSPDYVNFNKLAEGTDEIGRASCRERV